MHQIILPNINNLLQYIYITVIKHKLHITKGFPRITGKSKYYKISKDILPLQLVEYEMTSMMAQLDVCIAQIIIPNSINLKLDLVYGDIVEFEASALDQPHQIVYNGNYFEHFNYDNACIAELPAHYLNIYNDVPADYWMHPECSYFNVRFDFTLYIEFIIDNIMYDSNRRWITHFTYNLYDYTIYFVEYNLHDENTDSNYFGFDYYTADNITRIDLIDDIRDSKNFNRDFRSCESHTLLYGLLQWLEP